MFHLAFSSGEEHASAAFHSIARGQSRGFEPRWPYRELVRLAGTKPT
jgi:hypothetical protein